ncbi:3-oxoacid CoA-transferase subunit B [Sinorhizobium meliloti]|nr:3-oxoacid CoA-transferase subunit B [Sinorhizobium meliloti]MDX1085467.1 3-oxoacid CoA-transferase subunit B [Sinorhizobium medicae]ARS66836.1 acyl CoA:acetate/3-ketoacid CoA transferase subunit beta [Sinorhizobium meliloti RU11/001]EHK73521.1 CoA transferase, subunit B [Sinorhizobium meliloti CCNWSX0020]MDE3793628.1 3-oxoacid CoA-transferase subunit B [Sinorhizobium meliloti]MDE4562390.1 3-oxoacid CoA-transferase subunit B [Sinorhizobium meliloti SM11]
MLRRAAADILPGMTVNLGIGLPTEVLQYVPANMPVCLHSENGITGVGPVLSAEKADRNLIDAGGAYVSAIPGTAFFDSAISFAIVRSGRLDLTLLGAFEVAANGDLANWKIPGKFSPGMGGAIELAQKARRVGVIMTHTDRKGNSKILAECTLPLTVKGRVNRIYTDMAILDVTPTGLELVEIAEGVSLSELREATRAPLHVADQVLG